MSKNQLDGRKHPWTIEGRGNQNIKVTLKDGTVTFSGNVVVNENLYTQGILKNHGLKTKKIENVTTGKVLFEAK